MLALYLFRFSLFLFSLSFFILCFPSKNWHTHFLRVASLWTTYPRRRVIHVFLPKPLPSLLTPTTLTYKAAHPTIAVMTSILTGPDFAQTVKEVRSSSAFNWCVLLRINRIIFVANLFSFFPSLYLSPLLSLPNKVFFWIGMACAEEGFRRIH